jgi:hypothetical protein
MMKQNPHIPAAPEAETGALGCVLLAAATEQARNAVTLLRRLVRAHFHDLRHAEVYAALAALAAGEHALDLVTVIQWLKDKGKLTAAGGMAYVAALPDKTPSVWQFPSFLAILEDKAKRRELLRLGAQARTVAVDESTDPAELVGQFADLATAVTRRGTAQRKWAEFLSPADCRKWTAPPDWVLVGDCHVTRGDITIIAGPPGCGKSRALLWLALQGAIGPEGDMIDPNEGAKWFGLPVRCRFKTAILQAENGLHRLKADFDTLGKQCKTIEKFLRVTPPPDYGFQFSHPEFRAFVQEWLLEFQPDVIGVDPWNRVIGEDGAADFTAALDNVRATVAGLPKPPAIVIIHHFKKGDGSEKWASRSLLNHLSGSYTLGSAARCVFGMLHASDESEEDRVVMVNTKNNNGQLAPRTAWHRAQAGFSPASDFDWAEFEQSGQGPGKHLTEEQLVALFYDGEQPRTLSKKQAVTELVERHGVGKSAAYNALSLSGRFAHLLRDQDGLLAYRNGEKGTP